MANAGKPWRQDVLAKQAEKILTAKRGGLFFIILLVIFPGEGNSCTVHL